MKRIAILGSTGSIGTQALEVVREQPEQFQVELLTCGNRVDLLIEQALEFKPNAVVIGDAAQLPRVKDALFPRGIKAYAGPEALEQAVAMEGIDTVLTALVGYAGLKPTLAAIDAGKTIALANKETLVVAGALVTKAAREKAVNIYPVDSEHSAIFQCLAGEWENPIEKIVLTASGPVPTFRASASASTGWLGAVLPKSIGFGEIASMPYTGAPESATGASGFVGSSERTYRFASALVVTAVYPPSPAGRPPGGIDRGRGSARTV